MIRYDFTVADHGTIMLLKPISVEAEAWVENHIPEDALNWCGAIVVEPRYMRDIAQGIWQDGLTIDG